MRVGARDVERQNASIRVSFAIGAVPCGLCVAIVLAEPYVANVPDPSGDLSRCRLVIEALIHRRAP